MKIGKNVLFKLMEIERVLNYKKNKFNNTYRHNYTWSKDIYIYIYINKGKPYDYQM